ncbi:GNAT family N-acetyltransferase [Sphaerisporangium aureirubrum]|uniref:GNAT family N-acetyltransferase n=1 Tax=Sphaerisporangium aureirubrum TaxID=1544736 RepID=A0ABW1NST0_9ACTN
MSHATGTARTARVFDAVPGRPPEWPELAADGPIFATERWLTAMRGRIPGTAYTFVLRESGAPRLALYGTVITGGGRDEVFTLPYVLTGSPRELPLSDATRAARAAMAPPPEDGWYPHLVVMLPGYECHPLGPLAGDRGALDELTGAITAWAADRSLRAVAFLYTPPSAMPLQDVLAGRGFHRVPLAYSCELDPPGDGFGDYLSALPRKRRTEARREMRRLAEAGVTVRAVQVDRPPADVVDLKCGHSAKYNGAPADPATVRARLEGLCAGSALLFRAEIAGTLVGYALFIGHAGVWYCVSTAMDYDRPDARHTYFATVFYEPARLAYESGVRRLHYGQGSWRAKTSRGCRAVELPGWVLPLDSRLAAPVAEIARTTVLAP